MEIPPMLWIAYGLLAAALLGAPLLLRLQRLRWGDPLDPRHVGRDRPRTRD